MALSTASRPPDVTEGAEHLEDDASVAGNATEAEGKDSAVQLTPGAESVPEEYESASESPATPTASRVGVKKSEAAPPVPEVPTQKAGDANPDPSLEVVVKEMSSVNDGDDKDGDQTEEETPSPINPPSVELRVKGSDESLASTRRASSTENTFGDIIVATPRRKMAKVHSKVSIDSMENDGETEDDAADAEDKRLSAISHGTVAFGR